MKPDDLAYMGDTSLLLMNMCELTQPAVFAESIQATACNTGLLIMLLDELLFWLFWCSKRSLSRNLLSLSRDSFVLWD